VSSAAQTWERRVEATAAFDKRHPNPSKNYGIHGVEFRFSLIGETIAVSFGVSTGWHLPSVVGVEGETMHDYRRALHEFDHPGLHPMPMSLNFHIAEPLAYMPEEEARPCDLLPGGKCWGDVSFLGADRPFFALVEGGLEGMWERLAVEAEAFMVTA
jgi:hypothetical protein